MSRGSWSFRQGSMPDDVHQYLLEHIPFMNAEREELEGLGFFSCCDNARIPDHIYYEGYFHAQPSGHPIQTLNPRYGTPMDKPAAPKPLRAFIRAFCEVNDKLLKTATDGDLLRSLYESGALFADLAVQVHAGDEIPTDQIGWHRDGINSCMHLALSFRGTRALHHQPLTHGRVCNTNEEKQALMAEIGEFLPKNCCVTWQQAPQFYLSSPFAFLHAVHYPEIKEWDDRIIAIQARVLLSNEEQHELYESVDLWQDAMKQIAITFRDGDVRMPTLEDVQAWEQRLVDIESSEGPPRSASTSAHDEAGGSGETGGESEVSAYKSRCPIS